MSSFEHTPLAAFNTASLAEAALAYAATGIPVFPLRPREKQPMVPHGFYRATTDASTIRRWWQREPRANIGVACGTPSGWWVIDIDPRHAGLASFAQLQRDLDRMANDGSLSSLLVATRRQLTGGSGAHLVFRKRTDMQVRMTSATNFAGYQGIDLRADRSYIAVAPSVHPSGGLYQWQNAQPLLLFPLALVERWMEHRRRAFATQTRAQSYRPATGPRPLRRHDPRFYLQYALSQASVGQRNRYALYLACRLVEDVGLTWNQAAPWMCEYAACVMQADHPYTEREALSALDWAFKRALAA